MRLLRAIFVAFAGAATGVFAGRVNLADRLASCGHVKKVLGNATIEAEGKALKYTATYCPSPDAEARDNTALPERDTARLDARQTCTQCPCANGSIQCFCHDLQFADSLFISSCSNSTPPGLFVPNTADCHTVAALMTLAPSGSFGFPVMTNGFYNVPARTILTWEFQGCGFAFFNDLSSSYNICAKDLANSANALASFCTDANNIEGLFQNDGLKSVLIFPPEQ
ncbi:hypothetical protein GGX14DRAFT_429404 [Mycena pura]|uniref:Uncharacterized protein n=1 Tax=Mycena pura TaxID=153505 RepID=A0AAD6VUS7_9AGAR|nr:hypothetical protein GGX14DRAFT_429404 [Mycena pura]